MAEKRKPAQSDDGEALFAGAIRLIEKSKHPDHDGPAADPTTSPCELLKREWESSEVKVNLDVDGCVEVRISEDEMSAYADFYPPSGSGNPLTSDVVQEALARRGIVFGINWRLIEDKILECNLERREIDDVLIARGNPPTHEIPEHFELAQGVAQRPTPAPDGSDRKDHKAVSPFVLVKKGDVLASLVPKREGTMGTSVCGRALPYHAGCPEYEITMGANIVVHGGKAIAGSAGLLSTRDHRLAVSNLLTIEGDVDFSTGHIDFPGDVLIRGTVADGFNICVGKSLFCTKTLDASQVLCGGSLVAENGIRGRKDGLIKVKEDCAARFVENCHIEADGPIKVERSAYNAFLYSRDKIDLGANSKVVGGKLCSNNGITVRDVGNGNGTKTELTCGIDYAVQRQLLLVQEKITELVLYSQRLNRKVGIAHAARRDVEEKNRKIESLVGALRERASELLSNLRENEQAEVIVKGQICPGCYVEICHIPYVVTQSLRRVAFWLDKEKGRVAYRDLGRKPT